MSLDHETMTARVAVLADHLEEGWTSMDHYAAMLVEGLRGGRFNASLVRPPFRRRARLVQWAIGSRPSHAIDVLVNRYFDYPRQAHRLRGFDLFHIVDQTYAHITTRLRMGRTVVTCHDIDLFDPPTGTPHSGLIRWSGSRTLPGLQAAARVLCDSEAIRREITARRLVAPERLAVAPLGVEAFFRPDGERVLVSSAEAALSGLEAGSIVLHVGGTTPRKRLDLLLRVFARIRSQIPAATLIRVGGPLSSDLMRIACTLGIEGAIVEMPFLSRQELAALYRRVNLLILTSETEGFGLPVLEAMTSGVPVVSRDLPAVREVGGDAPLFVTGEDPEAYAAVSLTALRDDGVRDGMRLRGIARAAPFRWERTAELTGRTYQEILSGTAG